jgi:TonB family protein
VLVAETSTAMTAVDRRQQRTAIGTVLAALPAASKVTLLAADWDISALAEKADPATAKQALDQLDAVVSAGALHLERALTAAAARAGDSGAAALLFVGRGLDSFSGDAVHGPLAELRQAGLRLSFVATHEIPAPLADAAALTGGEVLDVAALGREVAPLVAALRARPSPPALAARGVDWHPLETVTGETVWMGRALEIPGAAAGGPAIAVADAADLVPLWDRARLAWSEHADRADRSRTTALTPLRALLVLETEYEYKRFGLFAPEEQRDVAATGSRDSAVGRDAAGVLGALVGNQIGEAYSVGGLGLIGTGASGGGAGEGTIGLGNLGTIGKGGGGGNGSGFGRGASGLGGRRARLPEVEPGQATVRGPLEREIIRRIVRRHINEVKYCYEQQLVRKPDLGGRILVQFTIAPSGQVIASALENSTMGDARVEGCAIQAVRRWEFPGARAGGITSVVVPFVMTPGAGPASLPPALMPAPPASPAAEPDLPTEQALAALAEKGALAARVEEIASLLGLDRTSDPESLAWMIDRRNPVGREVLLVARLLVAAHRTADAIRVLSEWAPTMPAATAEELRRMGAGPSATEVLALSRRL